MTIQVSPTSLFNSCLAGLAGAIAPVLAPASSSEENPYVVNNGVLMMEVESVEPEGDWTLATEIGDFLGDGYFEWTGPNYFGTPGNGLMVYHFEIQDPGYYQLWVRSYNVVGTDPNEHNDLWAQIPTAQTAPSGFELPTRAVKVFQHDLGRWTWETEVEQGSMYPFRVYLDEGIHELHVSGRSQGFAIDRLMLYQYQHIWMFEPAADDIPPSPLKSETLAYFTSTTEMVGRKVRLRLDASLSVQADVGDPIEEYVWFNDDIEIARGKTAELIFSAGDMEVLRLVTITQSGQEASMMRRIQLPLAPIRTHLVDDPVESLFWESYSGRFNSMPDLRGRVPANQGWDSRLDFNRFTERTGAFQFIGYLPVEEAGLYRFGSRTDAGIRVWIGEQIVLDDRGIALHEEAIVDLALEEGYYRVKVEFHLGPRENNFRLRFTGLDEGSTVSGIPQFVYHREESHPWLDAYYLGEGWYYSTWIGSFSPDIESDWIFSLQTGWTYVFGSDPGNVWFWTDSTGYAWTNKVFFPFVYQASTSSWILWSEL